MTDNHYAPPKANVIDAPLGHEPAPALWNPNAAGNWSLLFSTIFGSYLHWKNEEAIGDARRIDTARRWFFASLAVVSLSVAFAVLSPATGRGALRGINFLYLLVWYFSAAKPQAKYVEQRYGRSYPRRGWLKPILAAIGLFFGVSFGAGILIGLTRL